MIPVFKQNLSYKKTAGFPDGFPDSSKYISWILETFKYPVLKGFISGKRYVSGSMIPQFLLVSDIIRFVFCTLLQKVDQTVIL